MPALCPRGRYYLSAWSLCTHFPPEQRAASVTAHKIRSNGEGPVENDCLTMQQDVYKTSQVTHVGKENATQKNLFRIVKPIYQGFIFLTRSSHCLELGWSLQEPALTMHKPSALPRQKTPLLMCQLVWGLTLCIPTAAGIVFFAAGEWFPG